MDFVLTIGLLFVGESTLRHTEGVEEQVSSMAILAKTFIHS